MNNTNLEILMARRDALRALTYKTDTITAELERLYRLIEREGAAKLDQTAKQSHGGSNA